MSDTDETKSAEAAEKAYAAAAAEAVTKADTAPEAEPASEAAAAPLEFPSKPERSATPVTAAPAETVAAAPEPVKAPAKPKTIKAKPAPAKPAPLKAAKAKPAAPKKPAPKPEPTSKTILESKPIQFIKESIMPTKKKTADFTASIKAAAADVQAKAKAVLAKGSEAFTEASTFTKGNVEAVVSSGKILGAGLQDLGKTYVAEGKTAFETATADVKEIAAVKSPTEFVQLQGNILRRNFDHAIDFNTKTGETVIKLFGDAFAPISARASMVAAMVKKAA